MHVPPELCVLGQMHLAHAAFAKLLQKPISTEGWVTHWWSRIGYGGPDEARENNIRERRLGRPFRDVLQGNSGDPTLVDRFY